MISELSPQVLQAEALYEEFRNDRVSSISAMTGMAQRVASERKISFSKAIELISPSRQQPKQLAASNQPEVTVMPPNEPEAETSPLAYVSSVESVREQEIKGLFGIDSENSSSTKAALLDYQKAVTTHVLRSRLARTVEVINATPANGDRLYIPSGAFFEIKAGDRLRFGNIDVVIKAIVNSQELIIEPTSSPIEGVGYLLSPETSQEIVGFSWTDSYTDQLLESHLQAIYDFWIRERLAIPHDEPELEHLSERYEVFDNAEEEAGNGIESLSNEPAQPASIGEPSVKPLESTATAAVN